MRKDRDEYNAYMREYMLQRYHERMDYARRRYNNTCYLCGARGEDVVLNLHHVFPEEKLFTLSRLWSVSLNRFLHELEKCRLLCEACHIGEHASKAKHGTVQRYWRGCKCSPCKKAYAEYYKEYTRRR